MQIAFGAAPERALPGDQFHSIICLDMDVHISWYGQTCFRFSGRHSISVVTDPYSPDVGLTLPELHADIVTVSHHDGTCDYLPGVRGTFRLLDGPGEYEISGQAVYHFGNDTDSGDGTEVTIPIKQRPPPPSTGERVTTVTSDTASTAVSGITWTVRGPVVLYTTLVETFDEIAGSPSPEGTAGSTESATYTMSVLLFSAFGIFLTMVWIPPACKLLRIEADEPFLGGGLIVGAIVFVTEFFLGHAGPLGLHSRFLALTIIAGTLVASVLGIRHVIGELVG